MNVNIDSLNDNLTNVILESSLEVSVKTPEENNEKSQQPQKIS